MRQPGISERVYLVNFLSIDVLLFRILKVLLGVLIAYVSLFRNDPDTILGFYPPGDYERDGFDAAHAAFLWLACWLIYRGFKPATKRPVTPPQA